MMNQGSRNEYVESRRGRSWKVVGATLATGLLLLTLLNSSGMQREMRAASNQSAGSFLDQGPRLPFLRVSDPYLASGEQADSQASLEAEELIHLIQSDNSGIVVEFRTPAYQLGAETILGQRFATLSAEDMATTSQTHAPDMPSKSVLVGIPPTGEVYLDIESLGTRRRSTSLPIMPLAGPPTFTDAEQALQDAGMDERMSYEMDPAVYRSAGLFPRTPIELGEIGWLRDQRVIRIDFHPFQVDSMNHVLDIHGRLTARLTFDAEPEEGWSQGDLDTGFDPILESSLLNFESARDWRSEIGEGASPDQSIPPIDQPGTLLMNFDIEEEGMYRISGLDLALAGLTLDGLDPRRIQLYHRGQEVAIDFQGQDDGAFGPGDTLTFFGMPNESRYTKRSVYQLRLGTSNGARMASRDGTPAGSGRVIADSFRHTERYDIDENYVSTRPHFQRGRAVPPENLVDRWYSKRIVDAIGEYNFSVDGLHAAPGSWTGTVQVAAMGGSNFATVSPDHHMVLELGGTSIGEAFWDGHTRIEELEFEADASLFQDPTLAIKVLAPNSTQASFDQYYIDYFDFEYERSFAATEDVLRFKAASSPATGFDLTGFDTPDIQVLEISNPNNPSWIQGVDIAGMSAPYTARFDDQAEQAEYFAFSPTDFKMPAAYRTRDEVDLTDRATGSDYLIITHGNFTEALAPLLAHRTPEHTVELIDVQDIYDAYSYGEMDPQAIKDFLTFAYHNWPAPKLLNVLLVGDGSYDGRNNLGDSPQTYLPPFLRLADPWDGEIASDNWYFTVNGADYFPDLYFGRLPVSSPTETQTLVNKIIQYETSPPEGDWRSKVIYVTDADAAIPFYELSDKIYDLHSPPDITKQKIYFGDTHSSRTETRNAILDGFNNGALINNYIGHGTRDQWAGDQLLLRYDAENLSNGDKQFLMLDWTCLTGSFAEAEFPSLAEAFLLKANGGAIATYAPTGLGVATGHDYMNRAFYDALFKDRVTEIGALAMASKLFLFTSTGAYHDLIETYGILGDPALSIQLPDFAPFGPTSTATVLPVPSDTPMPTATHTHTPLPTATEVPTEVPTDPPPTDPPMETATVAPTATVEDTPTPGPSETATVDPDPSATATALDTPDPGETPSATATMPAEMTPTGTATVDPSATDDPSTPDPSATKTAEPTTEVPPTESLTPTADPTLGTVEAPTATASATMIVLPPSETPVTPTQTQVPPTPTLPPTATDVPPTPTIVPPSVLSLRLNQAVQDAADSMPLVMGRPAVLSADIELFGQDISLFKPRLIGVDRDSGSALSGGPLQAHFYNAQQVRFRVPASWTARQNLDLRVELVQFGVTVAAQATENYNLRASRTLELVLVPVQVRSGGVGAIEGVSVENAAYFGAQRIESFMPISDVEIVRHPAYRFESTLETSLGQRALLHQLSLMRALESPDLAQPMGSSEAASVPDPALTDAPERIYIGLLPDRTPDLGLAYDGGGVALARIGDTGAILKAMGLALGLDLVDCDPDFPFDPANPTAGGRIGGVGADIYSGELISGQAFDFMSNCGGDEAWVSAADYQYLQSRLALPAGPQAAIQENVWTIGGGYDLDRSRGFFDAMVPESDRPALDWSTAPESGIAAGFWRLQLLDPSGNRLGYRDLRPADLRDDAAGPLRRQGFALRMPRVAGASSLELLDSQATRIAQFALRSDVLPEVAAIVADAREGSTNARLIWEPRDPESDISGMAAIMWHRQAGKKDQLIFSHLRPRRISFDPSDLRGGGGVLDAEFVLGGLKTGHRDPLAPRPGHRPIAKISGSGLIDLPAKAPIILAGEGTDLEDGAVADDRLIWTIASLGIEMTGRYFELPGGLPAGRYAVTLRVVDEDGMFDLDQVSIIVRDEDGSIGPGEPGNPGNPDQEKKLYIPGLQINRES